MNEQDTNSILYMSTFPPRECGIATFSADLTNAIDRQCSPNIKSRVLAMNRNGTNIYNYPRKVLYQLSDSYIDDYIKLAKKINHKKEIKLVNIQHEFGIFGGDYGSYLVAFLEILEKPVIVTFHSVIPSPDEPLKKVVQSIANKVSAIIVMNSLGKTILQQDYGIRKEIALIPHGIPYTPFTQPSNDKKRLGYEDKLIISSFGMMSRGKGYEYVIRALPKVVEKFPNLLYLIVGETHPIVRKEEGEKYRNFLEAEIRRLNLQNHVKFYNKYLTLQEIIMYIRASDVYISASLDPNQITSGTLAYALGCGRPVISTPFLHAKEIVTPKRGILTRFRDSNSFAKAIDNLLSHPELRKSMASHAYHETRNMTWDNVALQYKELFSKHSDIDKKSIVLPKIRLQHLVRLTDNFGIIQFAKNTIPDKNSGYTLDDVARGLIATAMQYTRTHDAKELDMIKTYLNFIKFVQDEEGKLFNLVDANKVINKEDWSEDAHGRAIWALGYISSLTSLPSELKEEAKKIFTKSLGVNQCIESPRSTCFLLIGYHFYQKVAPSETNLNLINSLASRLLGLYKENSTKNWNWFEPHLTYDNSKLPESLFYAYLATKNNRYKEVAISSLNFLISTCFEKNTFFPIGQQGWYLKGKERAYFDQQPIEASSMVQTLLVAHQVTGNQTYLEDSVRAFNWFLGDNMLKQALYNEMTGGCYDGLGKNSININQGAESTISYILARLALEEALSNNSNKTQAIQIKPDQNHPRVV